MRCHPLIPREGESATRHTYLQSEPPHSIISQQTWRVPPRGEHNLKLCYVFLLFYVSRLIYRYSSFANSIIWSQGNQSARHPMPQHTRVIAKRGDLKEINRKRGHSQSLCLMRSSAQISVLLLLLMMECPITSVSSSHPPVNHPPLQQQKQPRARNEVKRQHHYWPVLGTLVSVNNNNNKILVALLFNGMTEHLTPPFGTPQLLLMLLLLLLLRLLLGDNSQQCRCWLLAALPLIRAVCFTV